MDINQIRGSALSTSDDYHSLGRMTWAQTAVLHCVKVGSCNLYFAQLKTQALGGDTNRPIGTARRPDKMEHEICKTHPFEPFGSRLRTT